MKLIDANVFIYAAGRDHPLKEACREVYRHILANPTAFNIDAEVLQEILRVYSSRGQVRKGVEMVRDLLVLFPRPIPIGKEEMEGTCDLMERYPGLMARDTLQAAVAKQHRAEAIVSLDSYFDLISEIRHVSPEQPG